ncbi:hypothetical protein [Alicyclobacillus shizuokensis]|uniref:hypothetical protein n=1 Tax=Alicyclobacillus shizuokensis TaxID=392014 RepID=UPI00082A29DD|nr:hypothetical protein [Alicyclobacillus shizuokensis]
MNEDQEFDLFEDMIPQRRSLADTPQGVTRNDEVVTSYLLVNALFQLLLRKGIIHEHEVNQLIEELAIEYQQTKRGQG